MLLGEVAQEFAHEESTDGWREAAKEPPAMHVRFGSDKSEWHRLTVDSSRRSSHGSLRNGNTRTACGKSIGTSYYATREESYDGRLCQDGCFTQYELELATKSRAEAEQAERDAMEATLRSIDAEREKRAAGRAEDKRRIDLATERHFRLEKPDKPDGDK